MAKKFKFPPETRPETRAFMKELMIQLEALSLIDGADTAGLTMICTDYDALLACHEEIREKGMFDTTPQGKTVPSAAFLCFTSLQTQIIKLLREYGLTPKARASLKRIDPGEEGPSPLEQLISNISQASGSGEKK